MAGWSMGGGGDIEQALAASDVVVERRIVNHRSAPAPIEPRSVLADYRAGDLVIHSATQIPHFLRLFLSLALLSCRFDPNDPSVEGQNLVGSVGGSIGRANPESPSARRGIELCAVAITPPTRAMISATGSASSLARSVGTTPRGVLRNSFVVPRRRRRVRSDAGLGCLVAARA